MKNIVFAGKTFVLPDRTAQFLEAYRERVRSYIAVNRLDSDLLFDLEDSIAERLTALLKKKKPIAETDAIAIVSSLGEPQEIFQDMLQERPPTEAMIADLRQQGDSLFQKTLNKQGKLFLGVFWRLSHKMDAAVWILRSLFLLALFVFPLIPFLLITYLLGYFVLSDPKPGRSLLSSFFRELFQFFRRFVHLVKRLLLALWNAGGGILRFAVFVLLGLGLTALSLAGMAMGPLLFTDPLIANQRLFAHVPEYARWLVLLFLLAAAVLTLWAFAKSFNRRALSGNIALVALLLLLGATFGLLAAAYSTALHYVNRYTEMTVIEIPVSQNESVTIRGLGSLYGTSAGGWDEHFQTRPAVEVLLTEGLPRVEIELGLRAGNAGEAEALFQKMADIRSGISVNRLELGLTEKELFKEPLPISFPEYRLRVYLPADARLRFEDAPQDFWLVNVSPRSDAQGRFYRGYCEDEEIFYDRSQKIFTCEISDAAQKLGWGNEKIGF